MTTDGCRNPSDGKRDASALPDTATMLARRTIPPATVDHQSVLLRLLLLIVYALSFPCGVKTNGVPRRDNTAIADSVNALKHVCT
jgi:hypothetical protein